VGQRVRPRKGKGRENGNRDGEVKSFNCCGGRKELNILIGEKVKNGNGATVKTSVGCGGMGSCRCS